MPRQKDLKIRKQTAFKEICTKLGIEWKDEYVAGGSTVTGLGIQVILEHLSEIDGIPPSYFDKTEKMIWRLLHKSQESFILSLELINKITVPYRLESFLFLYINAWELLLKAKILSDGGEIENKEDPEYTIGITKCLARVFNDHDIVYKNILKAKDLRNKAVHYFISTIPHTIMGILQAGVINYNDCRMEWFDSDITKFIQEGMMYLVVDADITKFSAEAMKKSLSQSTIDYLTNWDASLKSEIDGISRKDLGKYFFGIDISLAFKNNPSKADTFRYIGHEGSGITKVVQVKDPDEDYPFFTTELISEFQKRGYDINSYVITRVLPVTHKVKDNIKYCFVSKKHHRPQYSPSFVDWLIGQIEKDSQFIIKCKEKYLNELKEK